MSAHKTLVLIVFSVLLIGCDCSEPDVSSAVQKAEVEEAQVFVLGFVAELGPQIHRTGMTIADALELAGGYGKCEGCAKTYPSHPTYRLPPTLTRGSSDVDLKSLPSREDWLRVTLEPGDILTFKHILF